jgi:sigma-E factor negative regulatory protein RseB
MMPAMSLLRRPALLLTAAATITVPSMLAGLAVLAHEHVSAQASPAVVALGDNSLPETSPPGSLPPSALPAVLTAGTAEARDAAAQMAKVSGMSARAALFTSAEYAEDGVGLRLLAMAATASLNTTYQGVELIGETGVDGTVTVVSKVWHLGGGLTVTQTQDATVLTGGQAYVAYDGDGQAAEGGVFGVTKPLVALLGSHYVAQFSSTSTVDNRPALVVELQRADGTVAARFWLDAKTMVPLQREVFDDSGRMVSQDAFLEVQFGSLAAPPAATNSVPSAWAPVAAPAKLLGQLDGNGWRLPATLPGGLSLYAAAQGSTSAGGVVDLGYSDGLSVVSLFVERGTLAKMAGWQRVNLGGHQVYVTDHSVTWAGQGLVYTVIADAPPQTVEEVVAALPENSPPGFFARLGRGLGRLAALVNPFR